MAAKPFPFLRLPLELRESIYSLYFKPADRLVQNHTLEAQGFFGGVYKFDFGLSKVNKQLNKEANAVWQRENVFVKIATPWPSAVNHISSEGLVPIVCTDARSDCFTRHHALVQITAPFHQAVPEHTVVVLLDDLHLFAQTWYYSALSYPMLNDRLSTAFVLRDPYPNDDAFTKREISLTLQRRLLLPFEQIKGLHHNEIAGYAPSVKEELERRMAAPIPTLAECCERSSDFMIQGDEALAANKPAEGLNLYKQAFHAIHILIHGRTRRVLGDVFFHEGITTGRYNGQTGSTVRVVLRIKLVSRFILAYLKMQEWGEAAFWGMRTIQIMREAMDTEFEDFISEFVGGEDVGMIYVRTGLAFWRMELEYRGNTTSASRWRIELASHEGKDLAGSQKIWGIATKYLKSRDKAGVRKELEQLGAPGEVIGIFKDKEVLMDDLSTIGQDGSD